MKNFLFLCCICLSQALWSQVLGKKYSYDNSCIPHSSNTVNRETIHFLTDNTYSHTFTETIFSDTVIEDVHQNIISGNYRISNDTIQLENMENEGWIQSYLIDSLKHRLIHLNSYKSLYDSTGQTEHNCFEVNRPITIYEVLSNDTSIHCFIPIDRETGKAIVKIQDIVDYIPELYFLSRGTIDLHINNVMYDNSNRIRAFCATGWFDMNSLPWVVGITYIDETNLIRETRHTENMNVGDMSYAGTYQIFYYNDDYSLIRIDFHAPNGELTKSFQIL